MNLCVNLVVLWLALSAVQGAAGARVAVNYSSDREGAERVAQVIAKNGGEAIAVGADVSKAADVERLFKEVDSEFTDKGIGPRTCIAQDPGQRYRSGSHGNRRQCRGGDLPRWCRRRSG